MKRILPLIILLVSYYGANCQAISANHLITAVSMPLAKTDNYIIQKGFARAGIEHEKDTTIHTFYFKGRKRNNDTTARSLRQFIAKEGMTIEYETASQQEFNELRRQLKKEGFNCRSYNDTASCIPMLFQYRDISAFTSPIFLNAGEDTLYSVRIQKKALPGLKEILYGEDLMAFQSHENLVYVFGEKAVKKDLYYFSEKEFSRCSVLFPNTDKQAVFIWQDEMNDCGLSHLVLGGQLMLESQKDYHLPVAENSWMLKSKVHAGMNLRELRRLNGNDFSFYSVRSKYSGMVLPETAGNIDFKKEGVVLACMNCNDMGLADENVLTADEAIRAGRSFFVFSIMLYPTPPLALK